MCVTWDNNVGGTKQALIRFLLWLQEKRAAALAQEMREVGIPVDSLPGQEKIIVPRKYSTCASASPSLVKKTVPVSVIRKSPSASAYSFTHEKFSDVRPPVAEPLPVVSIDQPMFASQLTGRVVLVPSVIFRIDGLVSGSADQLYIPQNTYAYNSFIRPRSPTQSLQDDIPLLIKARNDFAIPPSLSFPVAHAFVTIS